MSSALLDTNELARTCSSKNGKSAIACPCPAKVKKSTWLFHTLTRESDGRPSHEKKRMHKTSNTLPLDKEARVSKHRVFSYFPGSWDTVDWLRRCKLPRARPWPQKLPSNTDTDCWGRARDWSLLLCLFLGTCFAFWFVGFCWVMWQILPTKDSEDPTTYQRFLSSGKTSLLAKPTNLASNHFFIMPLGYFQKSLFARAACCMYCWQRRASCRRYRRMLLSCSSSSPNRSVGQFLKRARWNPMYVLASSKFLSLLAPPHFAPQYCWFTEGRVLFIPMLYSSCPFWS